MPPPRQLGFAEEMTALIVAGVVRCLVEFFETFIPKLQTQLLDPQLAQTCLMAPYLTPVLYGARTLQFVADSVWALSNCLERTFPLALIDTFANRVNVPAQWGSQVVTRRDAALEFIHFLGQEGLTIIGASAPLSTTTSIEILKIAKKSISFPKWLLELSSLRNVITYAIEIAIRIIFNMFRCTGAIVVSLLLASVAERIVRGTFLDPLSQETPRERVETTEGDVIQRRQKGGSPP